MNHRKLNDNNFVIDNEPDYVFIVNKTRAGFLKNQLEELKLDVREVPCIFKILNFLASLNEKETIFVIYFSDYVLDEMAEVYELPVRLLDNTATI